MPYIVIPNSYTKKSTLQYVPTARRRKAGPRGSYCRRLVLRVDKYGVLREYHCTKGWRAAVKPQPKRVRRKTRT